MGKSTGFLDYPRAGNPEAPPLARIGNYDEFRGALPQSERLRQAARCMDCGVPFCQSGIQLGRGVSGCPLHNLIPEWNDLLYRGNFRAALERLLLTNSFPEFTGRVCPALCEAACTCSLHGDAVCTKENELAIIEQGFADGLMQPRPPKIRTGKKVAVVGSGPCGLAAASRLNLRGHEVTVFERDSRFGGLLMFGIPNMKLDKAVVERRIGLMQAEGVQFCANADVGGAVSADALLAEYDAVLLACGAKRPRPLAAAGFAGEGAHYAVDFLTAATQSLLDPSGGAPRISAKGKNVVVVGGGDTGNDCVGTCIRQGCKSVLQLEMLPEPPAQRAPDNPWPQYPFVKKTDYGQQEAIALFGRDPRVYCTTVRSLNRDSDGALRSVTTVRLGSEPGADGRAAMQPVPGSEQTIPCELLLVAAGFLGCEPYTPAAFSVGLSPRGTVQTAPDGYGTGVPKLFCAGDMRRGQSLVVWAIAEGRAAAREIDGYLMGYTNL